MGTVFARADVDQLQMQGVDSTTGHCRKSKHDILSSAPIDQAESVAEAIMRHQDLCDEGKITALGQLLQLATIFGTFKSDCRVSLHAND